MQFRCFGKVPANSDFVGHTMLLRLKRDDKGRSLKRAMQNKLSLFTRERARHPASKEFFLEVLLDIRHVGMGRRIIGENNPICQCGHAPNGKAVPQVARKERIVRCQAMFEQKRLEGIGVVRMWNVVKNRRVIGSR